MKKITIIVGYFFTATVFAQDAQVSVEEVVSQCAHQTIDQDLTATMTIVNRHRNGGEKRSVYKRFVKNGQGKGGVHEKMLLASEYPPEASGMGFLRWEYTEQAGKYPDQWLYTPSLRNVRKISVRDDQERFLGSTLTLGDIGVRPVGKDTHRMLKQGKKKQTTHYIVESIPVNKKDAYSKRVHHFINEDDWATCRVASIDYYDKKGLLEKKQNNRWQRIGESWVWQHVTVENVQTKELSTFQLDDVKVNVGLKDSLFSKRQLRRVDKITLK